MKNLIGYLTEKLNNPNVKDKVIEELYDFIPKTLISTFILSIIFTAIFWVKVESQLILLAWLALMVSISVIRYVDYKHYQRDQQKNSLKWYYSFNKKALIHVVLWGITPILFLLDLGNTDQIVMILFLFSIATGITGFIYDFRMVSNFISVLLLPMFIMLFFSMIPFSYMLQFIILIFFMLLLIASKHLNKLFYDTYATKEQYNLTKQMLSNKEKKFAALLEQAPIGIFYYDENLQIVQHNTMFKKLFGIRGELKAFDLNQIKDTKVTKLLKKVLETSTEKESIGSFNFSFQNKKIWIELTCSSLLNDYNKIIGGIGTIEDKSLEHSAYERINYISLHDALTGLPNRRSYQEYMQSLITEVEHTDSFSFLFYMDLNHFKKINDTFGHVVGDKLLLEVANRYRSLEIDNKYLSRIGGDEFIMIIPFYTKEADIAKEEAKKIAMKIKELFNPAFLIEGLELYMTTSIGIVIVEPNANNTEQIIRQADMAMYQTKREGLNNIRFYDHSLDIEQQELTSLQHDLKSALENDELELYYQPIVSITNNSLNAVEALVRWNHPTKGLIMPDRFIPMATESGLITKIGWWIAQEVCQQLSIWKKANVINFEYISVNINARQLNEIKFVDRLDHCIKNCDINPSLLKLELTETTLLNNNFEKTKSIIQHLKEKGVECSIDDFGTGYSSLSYLKKFAFKVLKIDKIFTQDMLTNSDNQELIKSIIAIGKQFNYKIIIEGVETEQQKEELMKLDDSIYYQGFLCSKAIPAKEFESKFLTYIYHI
jgi:diguanylate cyclase (GGDEF)-like protein/PAS domain S-box-containing protein